MNRGWSSLYSRTSSRRPVTPPPDYSGILFDNSTDQNTAQPAEMRDLLGPNSGSDQELHDNDTQQQAPDTDNNTLQNNTEKHENITLPLPMPEMQGLGDCSPRFPLIKRQNKKYTAGGSSPLNKTNRTSGNNPLIELFENTEFDDLLLAGLILMMLECGAERNIIFLLAILLIS